MAEGVRQVVENCLKIKAGVHVASGSPLPGRTGADWDSKVHVDGVIIAPTITVDGQILMDHGQFTFD